MHVEQLRKGNLNIQFFPLNSFIYAYMFLFICRCMNPEQTKNFIDLKFCKHTRPGYGNEHFVFIFLNDTHVARNENEAYYGDRTASF